MPAASVAQMDTRCGPSASRARSSGEAHRNEAAESSAHSKVQSGSLQVNSKVAVLVAVGSRGCLVIVVSGDVRSIVHSWRCGGASVFPTRSVAPTENECRPSDRPE